MRRNLLSAAAGVATVCASLGLSTGVALAAGHKKPVRPSSATNGPGVRAHARLYALDAFFVRRDAVTVPGRLLHVTGVVHPYVAGQMVRVSSFIGGRRFKSDTLRIKPSRTGRAGVFVERLRAPGSGIVRVAVVHARTAGMAGFTSHRGIESLSTAARPGSRGLFVSLVQQCLAALHLYLPQTGVWDEHTGLAIDAYHRLLHRGTSASLDAGTLTALLDRGGAFKVRYPGDGKHVEGDLGDQLLALTDGSRVQAVYPISSGKPSTPTILGRFRVYLRTPGYLPDGMYYSDFFSGGYAIHGYDPAPNYPASHGCMRLPISDALPVWHWLSYGVRVDVYR